KAENSHWTALCSCLDGAGLLSSNRGRGRFSSKKYRQNQNLDEAQLEIQELHHSLNSNMSLKEQTIAEENLEQSDMLINNHSFLKHNKNFHKLFQEIPEGENLIHTFTCALQKELLYHGKLFISENHVCFYSSVLLKDTKVVIPVSSVREVKKHNSALSMLSIQTSDGEKSSFVSLRNRDMCYKFLQSVCSKAQKESADIIPHLSSAENETDQDVLSSYSSLEDSVDHDFSSSFLDNSFSQMSSEGPSRYNSTHQRNFTNEDNRDVFWIWRVAERVTPFFFSMGIRKFSLIFYIYMMLLVLLLLVSGYIGLKIVALEEQLNSLGALTELSSYHREYQET
ncbi:GRAM domain-containing protein 2B-like, partial [Brachyistius frenatus]|uniref:GRAM domain-containing protein 2B-like n=1 Tax=Brachyistius frenatus TaxID=100188 RepID=UPI0037E9BD14